MKLCSLFLIGWATADESSEEPRRGVRGFVGPSSGFLTQQGESPWPVRGKLYVKYGSWLDY